MGLFSKDIVGATGYDGCLNTEYDDEKPAAYSYRREYKMTTKEMLRILATVGKNTAGLIVTSAFVAAPIGVVLYRMDVPSNVFVAVVGGVSIGITLAGWLYIKDMRAEGKTFHLVDEFNKHAAVIRDKIVSLVKRKTAKIK